MSHTLCCKFAWNNSGDSAGCAGNFLHIQPDYAGGVVRCGGAVVLGGGATVVCGGGATVVRGGGGATVVLATGGSVYGTAVGDGATTLNCGCGSSNWPL